MLVFSRKVGEKFYIGDDICVKITEIKKNKIRIGVEAPKDKRIAREEILTEDQLKLIERKLALPSA